MNTDHQSIKTHYKEKATTHKALFEKNRKKLNINATIRITVFVIAAIGIYFSLKTEVWIVMGWLLLSAIVFASLVKLSERFDKNKKWYKTLQTINEQELDALEHKLHHFENGIIFADTTHAYSYDLDIFSNAGFYQHLNRTSRPGGSKLLATWLQNPLTNFSDIAQRQQAFGELTLQIGFRQQFIAHGRISPLDDDMQRNLLKIENQETGKPSLIQSKIFRLGLPLLTISVFTLNLLGFLPFGYTIIAILLQWIVAWGIRKKTQLISQTLGKSERLLQSQQKLIQLIQNQNWKTELLIEIQEQLGENSGAAHREMKKLAGIVKKFEARYNMAIYFIANSFLLWDLQCLATYTSWHNRNKLNLKKWMEALDFIDAANSCANYTYNNPEFTFPTLSEQFQIEATQLAHPLIEHSKRIANDYCLKNNTGFHIVTGANMAGKSTFLRTVSLNLIMAMSGLPVCAKTFHFSPTSIFTSMRTADSLSNDESYFYAELKRLKTALELIKNGKNTLLILDEILKGTNSTDKRDGSMAFLKQLLKYKVHGIIATHDIQLGELETTHPEYFKNYCFEITIEPNEILFDYKLRPGITQTMNAQLLMKQMGLID